MKSFLITVSVFLYAFQMQAQQSFTVIPLGVEGGLDESNLSSYMVSADNENYICLDAGTLYAGISKALSKNLLPHVAPDSIIRKNIKGYLISHAHLDHVAGLIINSPNDVAKNIYAMPYTISVLEQKYFTWESWANFADEGEQPLLKKYHYVALEEGKELPLQGTNMFITPFVLSHSAPYKSTAFLIRSDSSYLLYLGDTGADSVEKTDHLFKLWKAVAPLVIKHQLKAIFIETSYPNAQPVKQLFGHLTPHLLMREMYKLDSLCNHHISNLNIVITHIKPAPQSVQKIKQQLNQSNNLKLHFIFPQQATLLHF